MNIKRYNHYPASHFSRWRFAAHRLTLFLALKPYMLAKYKPIVSGRENIPKQGPFIVAANHISLADPPLLSAIINYPIAFMAKKELFKNIFLAEFLRFEGTFALDREQPDSSTLKTALYVLRSPQKWALGIFPEGTRSTTGEILPLKKGIGGLATKTQTPILPVGLRRAEGKQYIVNIGKLITDVQDADTVQEVVYNQLVYLTQKNAEDRT